MTYWCRNKLLNNQITHVHNLTKTIPYDNAFWPTAMAGEADMHLTLSTSACRVGGPKGVIARYD